MDTIAVVVVESAKGELHGDTSDSCGTFGVDVAEGGKLRNASHAVADHCEEVLLAGQTCEDCSSRSRKP